MTTHKQFRLYKKVEKYDVETRSSGIKSLTSSKTFFATNGKSA